MNSKYDNQKICRLRPDSNGVVGKGVRFDRIRRITGYLSGSLARFNSAKRAEVADRVVHFHGQK